MKKFVSMLAIASALVFTWACEDEDPINLAEPELTTPAVTSVSVNGSVDITFNFTAEAGFASAAVTNDEGGTGSIKTNGTAGATSGSIVVTFAAGATPGAGSVTVTITDGEGDTDEATATITVSPSAVPTIAGIPATASIVGGETLEVAGVVLTAQDGFASSNAFTLTINDGDPINLSALITGASPATVAISYETSLEQIGTNTLVFTLTDADGDETSFTHVLTVTAPVFPVVVVQDNISSNTTWTKDNIYELAGRVTVLDGVTLTIEAGTVIKGQSGTGSNATALLVARGAKLIAEGTAEEPIIFTSTSDQIVPGLMKSPNLAPDVNGLWGGVIILGKARISASNSNGDVSEVQIEGIPTSDPNGLYGGSDDTDNSGVIKYVSIRHGGTNIGAGNEINGLTLGGVGSGTVIENVEVVANQDDGIEWFGGTVNVKNIVVWNAGDDALDTDQAWSGTAENFIVVHPTGHCFELDGPEGSYGAALKHTFLNGTVVASSATRVSEDLINTDANSGVILKNIFITGIATGQKINRVNAANVTFDGVVLNVAADALLNYLPTGTTTAPAGITAGTTGTKADASILMWTWAGKAGGLNGL